MHGSLRDASGQNDFLAGHSEGSVGEHLLIIGNIQTVIGSAVLTRASGAVIQVKAGDRVCVGDVIETAADGLVGIHFIDATTFNLSSDTRIVLNDFVCDPSGTLRSALFDVARGSFAFTTGQVAPTGFLTVETPVANIRGRARTSGIGALSLTALTFAILDEVQAAHLNGPTFLDPDVITYKDLRHGVFEVVTKELIERRFVVDDPAKKLVISKGAGVTLGVEQITNTPLQMAQAQADQHVTFATYVAGLVSGQPTSTPQSGSSDPLVGVPPAQPINFVRPDDHSSNPQWSREYYHSSAISASASAASARANSARHRSPAGGPDYHHDGTGAVQCAFD